MRICFGLKTHPHGDTQFNDQDAEELVFRTFDQAKKKIRLFDPSRNFFTWLYAIMLNFHRMNHRRRRVAVLYADNPLEVATDVDVRCPSGGACNGRGRPLSQWRGVQRTWTSVIPIVARTPLRWTGACA